MSISQTDLHNYQWIVDCVRQAAILPASYTQEELSAIAANFADLRRAAAERLQRCCELLHAGQRSEAIRLANLSPKLIDLLAALDFPEAESWSLLCETMDLPLPPPLAMERAAELNEAYAAEQPLQQLLRQWRLQAIAGSSLAERLVTLRRLAACEPQNVAWQDDLVQFEKARLEEIAAQLAEVRARRDVRTLAAWAAELNAAAWSSPIPQNLVAAVHMAHREAVAHAAREEMARLAPRLHEAYAALDESAAYQLRQQWDALGQHCPLADNDPLAQQVAPAFQWLEECDARRARQEEHRRAVADLERALERRRPAEELQRLYLRATRDGQSLPLELQRRYELMREEQEAQAALRRRVGIVGAAALAGALLVGLAAALWEVYLHRSTAEHQQAIQRLLDEKKFTEAQQYIERLRATHPAVASRAPILELAERITSQESAERSRKERLERYEAMVRQSLATVPDRQALEHVRKLAQSEEEKRRLAELELAVQARETQLAADRTERGRAELARLRQQLAALEKGPLSPLELLSRLAEVHSAAVRLRQQHEERLAAECDVVIARIQKLEHETERRVALRKSLESVQQAAGDLDTLAQRLRECAARNASDPNASDFTKAAAESHLWKSLDQWNAGARQWRAEPLARLDAKQAEARAAWLAQWMPWVRVLAPAVDESVEKSLAALCERQPGRKADLQPLETVWSDPLVKEAWLVELDDGRRYYTLQPLPTRKTLGELPCVMHFDFTERKVQLLDSHVRWKGRSPQSVLSQRVREELASLDHQGWEETFGAVLDLLLAKPGDGTPAIEPLLRYTLLTQTLRVARAGSYPLAAAWEDVERKLSALAIPSDLNWLKGSDPAIVQYGSQVEKLFATLTDAQKRRERVRELASQVEQARLPELHWVGILLREEDRWTVLPPTGRPAPAPGSVLFCLAGGSNPRPAIIRLGKVEETGIQWERQAAGWRVAGRPVAAALHSP